MPVTPFTKLHLFALAAGACASLLPRAATINIVQGNDDGWAEANARLMYSTLSSTPGYATLISSPAINWSGSGSLDIPALPAFFGGQYGTIAPGAPATGSDPNDPRINYVNSFPVTAIKYGLKELSNKHYGGLPDLVITGPNVGANIGIETQFSGTVGAANEAILQKVPAIAFSGASGPAKSYKELQAGDYSHVYVDLAMKVIQTLTTKKPYLPPNIGLNVNFSAVNATSCTKASEFKFIQTRIFPNLVPFTQDTAQCGSTSLPAEGTVADAGGCTVSISGFTGGTKLDVGEDAQAYIRQKLSSLWGCL